MRWRRSVGPVTSPTYCRDACCSNFSRFSQNSFALGRVPRYNTPDEHDERYLKRYLLLRAGSPRDGSQSSLRRPVLRQRDAALVPPDDSGSVCVGLRVLSIVHSGRMISIEGRGGPPPFSRLAEATGLSNPAC